MLSRTSQRMIGAFAVCALLNGPLCWATPLGPRGAGRPQTQMPSPTSEGILDWLSGLIEKAGCTLDPDGCSKKPPTNPTTGTTGAGCTLDPSGCSQGMRIDSLPLRR